MRLRLPLVPFAVRFERRPFEPFRCRFTVLESMMIVALLALVVWLYVTRVSLPAARQRWQRAEGLFRLHLAVMDEAYQEEAKRERDTKAAAQRCFEFSEREYREAERLPEVAEERTTHRDFAARWHRSGSNYIGNADLFARRARLLKGRIEELSALRRWAAGSIPKLEEVAKEAEKWPETPEWESLHLGEERAFRLQRMLAEQGRNGGTTSLQVGNKPMRKLVTPGL